MGGTDKVVVTGIVVEGETGRVCEAPHLLGGVFGIVRLEDEKSSFNHYGKCVCVDGSIARVKARMSVRITATFALTKEGSSIEGRAQQ